MESPHDFPPLQNDAILKTARGEVPHRIPIWIMRQAGRYLPEFQEVRKKHSFFEVVNNPSLAAQVTLQPIERYDLDAAIIFSDILVIPQALGLEVQMLPNVGPVLPDPVKSPADIDKLDFQADVKEKMKGTLEAITLTRKLLNGKVPLFGFSGAPWTLMAYMIEGGGSKVLSKSKSWLYKYPEESKRFLSLIGNMVINYLVEQVVAGAQILQLFESHADLLSPALFRQFCIPVIVRIQEEVANKTRSRGLEPVPMVLFAKGAHYALKDIANLKYEVIGVDWTVDPQHARQMTGNKVLQGNLDPVALFGTKDSIQDYVSAMIEGFGTKLYICNLGHGIYPETPTKSVQAFIDAVHSHKV